MVLISKITGSPARPQDPFRLGGVRVVPQQADVTFAGREALVPLFLLKASGRRPDVAGEDLDVEVVEQLPNFITRVRHVLISRINTI